MMARFVPVKMVDVAGLVQAPTGARTRQSVPHRPQRDRRVDPRRRLLGQNRYRGRDYRGHDPREDIDFLEEELDEWYLDVLEKGLEKFETRYHGADAAIEKELAEQMSAFGIDKDRMKQVILAEGARTRP